MSSRFRNYCFTAFTPIRPPWNSERWEYYKGVQEICPKTKTPHWQCTVHLKNPCTFSAFKKSISEVANNPHIEVCHDLSASIVYCTLGKGKGDTTGIPGTCFEFGVKPAQGTRTDLQEACAIVVTKGLSACSDTTIVKFGRGLSHLRLLRMKPYAKKRQVDWYWGPTGTGKTHTAYHEAMSKYPDSVFICSDRSGWMDGYDGEKAVVIDDYSRDMFLTERLFNMFDSLPHRYPVKCSSVPSMCEHYYVTSHSEPSSYVQPSRVPELMRRITRVHHLTQPYVEFLG